MIRALTCIFALLTALVLSAGTAQASDKPSSPWAGSNPYVFTMGDSLVQQCADVAQGWRSLGIIGWPGATTTMMRERMSSSAEGWDWTTESSHAEEMTWFRDAGSWVIGLGTNDVKTLTVEQWRDNIDWFMEQSRGRPVAWYTTLNPPFQAQADLFNWELYQATYRWPNLKLIEWHKWAQANRWAIHPDGVHVSTAEGCIEGRDRLARHAVADVSGDAGPRGYWYESSPLRVSGWGAGNEKSRQAFIEVNVRANYAHVGRYPVQGWTGDLWAQTASGRAFDVTLPSSLAGQRICVDLVDAAGRFTSLGCR